MVEQFASLLGSLLSWLNTPAPAWLTAALLLVMLMMLVRERAIIRRLNRHAESIGHMDAWADEVDEKVNALEERARSTSSAYRPVRPRPTDAQQWRP